MIGVNKVILVGNLGKDPEIKHFESGKSKTTVSLATTETYKNKMGERVTNTEWHNVIFWSPLSDIVHQYLKKGSKLYVEGKITNRSYEDKEGNTRYITEVVGRDMVMLDSKNTRQDSDNLSNEESPTLVSGEIGGENELPF